MERIVGAVILGALAFACFVFSCFQFCEKGFPFNNAYLYATEQERETMNKTPYYKQSAVCFLLIGVVFLIHAIEIFLQTGWLFFVSLGIIVAAVIFAVISSIVIENRKQ